MCVSLNAVRNVRRAKQQMCMCQTCTNFKGYHRVLNSLPKLFEAVTHPPQPVERPGEVDDNGVANSETETSEQEVAWAGADDLARLLAFCSHEMKSGMVADVLCHGVLDLASSQPAAAGDETNGATSAALSCLNGTCVRCGFKKLWSQGLRKKLVVRRRLADGTLVDDLLPDVPVEFQSQISWTRISSSKAKQPGR